MKKLRKLGMTLLLAVLSVGLLFGCAKEEHTVIVTPVEIYPDKAETTQDQQIAP